MKTTRVVNIHRESCDVYIGRKGRGQDGYFGNPFVLRNYSDPAERERVLKLYTEYFHDRITKDPEFKRRIEALRGKNLGCFCKPQLCHGDIIAEYLDGQP